MANGRVCKMYLVGSRQDQENDLRGGEVTITCHLFHVIT